MNNKNLRNKIELVVILCYLAGLFLACWTKNLLFMGTVLLAVPISKYIKE